MRAFRTLTGLSLMLGVTVAAGHALGRIAEPSLLAAAGQASQAARAGLPPDIQAGTGNRFPAVKREELNDAGKKAYDARGAVDGFGPGAIRLYSPPLAESMTAANDYLRRKSGLEPRLVELAILVAAREMDCAYIWTAHEPAARKAGLEPQVIDAVKHRRPLSTLGEKEAVIIQLGRDSITKHKVASDTFARGVKHFGNQGVVNIVALMGDYAASSILLNVADQHVRPGATSLLPLP
jgi:4-carboxymuconolactone decarboxylase